MVSSVLSINSTGNTRFFHQRIVPEIPFVMVVPNLVLLFSFIFISSTTLAATTENVAFNPLETHHAECTLISGDVRASAEARVSRRLEGFCATDHMSRAFGNLEYRLLTEINLLRAMINMLLPSLYQQHYFARPQPQLYQPQPSAPAANVSSTKSASSSQISDQIQNESPFAESINVDTSTAPTHKDAIVTEKPTEPTFTSTEKQLEFKPVLKKDRIKPTPKKTGPREFEIHKFNNTILSGADMQIYTYYWKIEHFAAKLKSNMSTFHSPNFSISGLYLRVTATLNHLGRDYLLLQLEQVTMDPALDKSNIILRTGDMFKKIQTKLSFKHKIVILDQVTPTSDLISQEFENTSQGFLVPNSAIITGPYSKGDILLVKIVITL